MKKTKFSQKQLLELLTENLTDVNFISIQIQITCEREQNVVYSIAKEIPPISNDVYFRIMGICENLRANSTAT